METRLEVVFKRITEITGWQHLPSIDLGGRFMDGAGREQSVQPEVLEVIATLAKDISSVYDERNRVVAALAHLALRLGWRVWTARTEIEGWDPEWFNCVYIDTPEGNTSWHYHDREVYLFTDLPPAPPGAKWDGHTTAEKYARLVRLGATGSSQQTIRQDDEPHGMFVSPLFQRPEGGEFTFTVASVWHDRVEFRTRNVGLDAGEAKQVRNAAAAFSSAVPVNSFPSWRALTEFLAEETEPESGQETEARAGAPFLVLRRKARI
jgi:hypothetical protein